MCFHKKRGSSLVRMENDACGGAADGSRFSVQPAAGALENRPAQEKQRGGKARAQRVQHDVVDIEGTPENGLEQLDPDDEKKTGQQRLAPAVLPAKQGIKHAEGQIHEQIENVFPTQVIIKIQFKIKLKSEQSNRIAAWQEIEQKIPDIADNVQSQREAKQPSQITHEHSTPKQLSLRLRRFPMLFPIQKSHGQRNGKNLQKKAWVRVKKEI